MLTGLIAETNDNPSAIFQGVFLDKENADKYLESLINDDERLSGLCWRTHQAKYIQPELNRGIRLAKLFEFCFQNNITMNILQRNAEKGKPSTPCKIYEVTWDFTIGGVRSTPREQSESLDECLNKIYQHYVFVKGKIGK